jgi:hypothetical protein
MLENNVQHAFTELSNYAEIKLTTTLLRLIHFWGGYIIWVLTLLLFWKYVLPHLWSQSAV